MISIDNTPVEEALALAAPIRDQAHELMSDARYVEGSALAKWYQTLVRQVIDHHISPTDVMPWSIKCTVNCFVDTAGKFIEPMTLYDYVKAGWLDWLNFWIEAPTKYHRDNINIEARSVFEEWQHGRNRRG